MRNFRTWDVWKNSKSLCLLVYETTTAFPTEEKYGLIRQIRRAAVSIPSNIAEGAGRNFEKYFKHFLHMSLGSSFELETLFDLSKDLNLINQEKHEALAEQLDHILCQLNSFINKL